jgi:hypothetical protein
MDCLQKLTPILSEIGALRLKRDNLLIAAVIGGLSTISGEVVTKILVLLNIGKYAVYELNSLIVTSDTPSMLMGFIINFIIGSYIGAMFYLVLYKLGAQHLVLKCIMGSLLVWFVFEFAFTFMIEGIYIDIRPISDHLVHIAGTAAFGLTLGIFLKLLVFNRIEKEKKDTKPDSELDKPV